MPVDTPPFMGLKPLAEPLSDLTMSKSFNDVVFVRALYMSGSERWMYKNRC